VREVALHYTDLINLPILSHDGVKLDEYFLVGVRVPDERSWPLNRVATDMVVSLRERTHEDDYVALNLRTEQLDAELKLARFRMDWHAVCRNARTADPEPLGARLRAVHGEIKKLFRQSFTKEAWELFEPVSDE